MPFDRVGLYAVTCRLSLARSLACILAALVAIVLRAPAADAQSAALYVTNSNSSAVAEFAQGAAGNLAPSVTVSGAATLLLSPSGVAADSSGNLYVCNFASGPFATGSITVYPPAGAGNAAPSFTIAGVGTQLAGPEGIALDSHGNIYVASLGNIVTEYTAGSSGNASPAAAITGSATMLAAPAGIALDSNGKIYVTNLIGGASAAGSITVYAPGSTGNAAPTLTIAGPDTGLAGPDGIALDAAGNIYVTNLTGGSSGAGSITMYAAGSNGDASPSLTIAGPNTALLGPQGIAVDSGRNIFVANSGDTITEFTPASSGDAAPGIVIKGENTGLDFPRGIALNLHATTATPTPTMTSAPTAIPTPTPGQTAAPTGSQIPSTPTPTQTAVQTPTPAPTIAFGCNPASSAAADRLWEAAKAAGGKPPKLKPIKFPKEPLGSSSAPLQATLTNTTVMPLNVTSVAIKGATSDFSQNSGCIGQLDAGASCYISVTFTPTRTGGRNGTLIVTTSGLKVSTTLSGVGLAPKVISSSSKSQAALGQVTFQVSGFAPLTGVFVNFIETLPKGKKGLSLPVAAQNAGSAITVVVPPVIDPSGQPVDGSAKVSVEELLKSPLSAKAPPLKIALPMVTSGLMGGTVTADFLQAEESFAMKLSTDLQGTPLGTQALESSLMQVVSQSGDLLATLDMVLSGSATSVQLGTANGANVTVGLTQLTTADDQLLSTMQLLANQGGSQSSSARLQPGAATVAQASGGGCLASEAQALLNDNTSKNTAAFAADLVTLFEDSETSPACKQPGPAETAAAILNGGGATALAILTQAGNPQANPALPSQALTYADLGPAGLLVGIGVSLAQTTSQAFQAVVNSVQAFNQAAGPQLQALIKITQGATLQGSFTSTSAIAASFDQAVEPLDGAYAGTFSGSQFFSGGVSCAINGAVNFGVSQSAIAVTAPGPSSGTLDNNGGSFTVTSAGVSCSFTGIFSTDTTGAASVSGTWSCTAAASASGLTSANGTWMASRQ